MLVRLIAALALGLACLPGPSRAAQAERSGPDLLNRMIAAWEDGRTSETDYYATTSADVPAYYLLAVAWGKADLPADRVARDSRALLARLAADAVRAGACTGWGIGAPLDAFDDGTVNPQETIYLYTTARVTMALLEAERHGLTTLDDGLLQGISCTLRTQFEFDPAVPRLRYSNNANDERYVVYNVFADLARAGIALGRRLKDESLMQVAEKACNVLIRRQREDGSLPYLEGGVDNDGTHHAMVVAGLFDCAQTFSLPMEPALRGARLLMDEFIGAHGELIARHPYKEWMLGESLIALRLVCGQATDLCSGIDAIAAYLHRHEKDGLINNANPRYQSWLAAGVAFAGVR